ncbi:hypothetical protein V6C53_02255 [Desulfocurvibacter africanus]|uniref:hypothetical protein n=1 Tax=Desulfocurvibacter africanus TaxID=873 RepID=UPI0004887CB0|nr:hypothetical protein [Desulfocurvibacter africanus]
MTHSVRLRIVLLLLGASLTAACAAGAPALERPEGSTLAVAGFTNPQNTWELLAGCLPEQCVLVEERVLNKLDLAFEEVLRDEDVNFISQSRVSGCREVVSREPQAQQRMAALRYWLQVGKCIPADYLLVPQLVFYHERRGGDWGAEEPASVIMDFFLLDVGNGTILRRYRFEETQQPLSENLLDVDKFVNRGGKWISAEELTQEGIEQAIKELGL